jgi:UDP-N-acetylglucosamine 2-epimerase
MKLLIIVGVRPQFVKAAPLLKAFEQSSIEVVLMHTGQHFDYSM